MTLLAQPKSYRLATHQPRNCIETCNNSNSLNFCQKKAKFGHLIAAHQELSIALIKALFWDICDGVWWMDVVVQVGPKVLTSEDKEPTTTLGILSFYYHLNRSDKSININKINSIYRILLYSSTFMFYRTIYTAPMQFLATQPWGRYRPSRLTYVIPVFLKFLLICYIESLFLLTPKT